MILIPCLSHQQILNQGILQNIPHVSGHIHVCVGKSRKLILNLQSGECGHVLVRRSSKYSLRAAIGEQAAAVSMPLNF